VGNYFNLLGLKPAGGTGLLTDSDDTGEGMPILWWFSVMSTGRRASNAAPDVAGKTLLINGHAFTILGVAPEGFKSAIDGL